MLESVLSRCYSWCPHLQGLFHPFHSKNASYDMENRFQQWIPSHLFVIFHRKPTNFPESTQRSPAVQDTEWLGSAGTESRMRLGGSFQAGHLARCGLLCVLSRFSHVSLYATPWTVAHQVPLSMGILQARILKWVAMFSSRGSSRPRDRTCVS